MQRKVNLAAGLTGLAAALGVTLGVASAQTAPGDIVVTAPSPKVVPHLIEAFGRSFTGDRLARWSSPICPYVMGLSKEQDGLVARRIGEVGKAAGLAIAPGECEPNILVFFSLTPDLLRKNLSQRSNYYFGLDPYGVDRIQLAEFLRDDGAPAHVFYVNGLAAAGTTGTAANSGLSSAAGVRAAAVGGKAGSAGLSIDPSMNSTQVLADYHPSRLSPHGEPSLQRVVLVIDGRRLAKVPITEVASYAAMVTLAEVRVSQPIREVATITALFADLDAGRPPAEDLTFWDRSYLGALYGAQAQASFSSQRSAMADRIAHAMQVLNVPTTTAGPRPPSP